jgi:hypothetical protein
MAAIVRLARAAPVALAVTRVTGSRVLRVAVMLLSSAQKAQAAAMITTPRTSMWRLPGTTARALAAVTVMAPASRARRVRCSAKRLTASMAVKGASRFNSSDPANPPVRCRPVSNRTGAITPQQGSPG